MNIQNWQPTKNCRICSDHFTREQFYTTIQTVRLHANAVPTVLNIAPTRVGDEDTFNRINNKMLSTGTDSLAIPCDYDDTTSTADDNIQQTSEIQPTEESVSNAVISSLLMTCYSDDENSPIKDKDHISNMLPVDSTMTPSVNCDDTLLVSDSRSSAVPDDCCTVMPYETELDDDMPTVDVTGITTQDKVAAKIRKRKKNN